MAPRGTLTTPIRTAEQEVERLLDYATLAAHMLLKSTNKFHSQQGRLLLDQVSKTIDVTEGSLVRQPCPTCGTTCPLSSPTHADHLRTEAAARYAAKEQ